MPLSSARQMRVFVSSTFLDMKAERDELVKRVFPKLRRLCESRSVAWGEVDLRWGITDGKSAEGKVLPICMEEIRRCHYFIGLVGERYGWLPDAISPELLAREPWLRKYPQRSVTELEILYGALRNSESAENALFYFRDPRYIERLPPDQRQDFLSDTPEASLKLAELKKKIRESGVVVRENYLDPQTLGQLVLDDLTRIVEQRFPPLSAGGELSREQADHEIFAATRTKFYIGDPEYFEKLDRHAAGDGPPMLVRGGLGSGKSALLANWALRYRGAHPGTPLLLHFIGSTPRSSDWAAMLRRLMGEFKRLFTLPEEVPTESDALRQEFPAWLERVASRGRLVLALDGLDRLDDQSGALDLVWLPPAMPSNIRLMASAVPGRAESVAAARRWDTLDLRPLNTNERRTFVIRYLGQFSKELSAERTGRIANARQSANPLYLRAVLEEMRLFGEHDALDQRIGYYLEARNAVELYAKILSRWEQDYQGHSDLNRNLVGDAMSILWASRHGLSETELSDLLGRNGTPLPRALWSPLFLAASEFLQDRAGLLTLLHDDAREAVRRAYLPTAELEQKVHRRLAEYFGDGPLADRQFSEYPWQLSRAGAWRELGDLLANPVFFKPLWNFSKGDIDRYWALIEANSAIRMEDVYRPTLDFSSWEMAELGWMVSGVLLAAGRVALAMQIRERESEYLASHSDQRPLAFSLLDQAEILLARGEGDRVPELCDRAEEIFRETGFDIGLAQALGVRAEFLSMTGQPAGAMEALKEEERLYRSQGNGPAAAHCQLNQATILAGAGQLDAAEALNREAEPVVRASGGDNGIVTFLNTQATIHQGRGEFDRALAMHREAAAKNRSMGAKFQLAASLNNQGSILTSRGCFQEALALHREAEEICRAAGHQYGLSISLGNAANALLGLKDLDGALALYRQQAEICEAIGFQLGLAGALNNQGSALIDTPRALEGLEPLRKAERIYRALGSDVKLAMNLNNQGAICLESAPEQALALHEQAEELCRRAGSRLDLGRSLANKSNALVELREFRAAIAGYLEAERIFRELNVPEPLIGTLDNLARIAFGRGKGPEALRLVEEGYALAQKHALPYWADRMQARIRHIRAAMAGGVPGA